MFKNEYYVHLFIIPSRASFMQAMNSLGLCSCKSLGNKITQFFFIPTVLEEQYFSLCLCLFSSSVVVLHLFWSPECSSPLKLIKCLGRSHSWLIIRNLPHNPRILRHTPSPKRITLVTPTCSLGFTLIRLEGHWDALMLSELGPLGCSDA